MYFMEAALGQYGQVGPMQIWRELMPAAMGVGVAMVTISLIVSIYYNVIMAYCLFYLFNSMRAVLPWTFCDEAWADARCYVRGGNSSSRGDTTCAAGSSGGQGPRRRLDKHLGRRGGGLLGNRWSCSTCPLEGRP